MEAEEDGQNPATRREYCIFPETQWGASEGTGEGVILSLDG